ncbi:50S ribosomal protein L9 [Zavarzinia sp. CC-PAN008]|uniref:50S ribosomal protein L9 n=1 Tax=Zavarzinia sp. CC-PAN008 TaxID=3243332 RepID=UPI003F7423FE
MDVILLERIEKLGQMGEVVRVKDGYARNFLFPRRKALRATKENVKQFETQRVQLETRNLEAKGEAAKVGAKMEGVSIVAVRQASESAQLYGSVSARDVAEGLTEAGYSTERRQVLLDAPLKTLGVHQVRVALHPEVIVTVNVNVARSEAEAELQAASGEAFVATGADAEELLNDEEALAQAERAEARARREAARAAERAAEQGGEIEA